MPNSIASGLTRKEYIDILKECGMCTKKWTIAKLNAFKQRKYEVIAKRKRKEKKQ